MTIQAVAYDDDSPIQILTYELYWNGNSSVYDTRTGTSGNPVAFKTVSGLQEYTTQTYSWRIEIRDDHGGVTEANNTDRTYCSGTGSYCSGPARETCTICGGSGYSEFKRCRWATFQCSSVLLGDNGELRVE